MDGIFGIGIAEMVIIFLALFIIGGPENTARWARQAGQLVRKLREQWSDVMAQVERELGPEGKEIMDVTREFSRNTQDLRKMSSPRHLMAETTRYVERSVQDAVVGTAPQSAQPASDGAGDESGAEAPPVQDGERQAKRYGAWAPRQDE